MRRTSHGATLVEPLLYEPFRYDTSFLARKRNFPTEKQRIGLAPAELVQPGETIGISAGTTTTYIGRALRHRDNITVVTNGLNIGMGLYNHPGVRTYLTGGVIRGPGLFPHG
jgi:DeoR family transcriptional regulator, aga operon transcriptional repressor